MTQGDASAVAEYVQRLAIAHISRRRGHMPALPAHRQLCAGVIAVVGFAAACQTLKTKEERGAVIGAAAGGAAGAIIGKQTGSTARGAIIGAAVGGAAGAIIGNQMDQKAKEIAARVPGATVTRVGEGLVVTFASGLLFDFDSDRLRETARENLDNLASSLAQFGDSKLLLVGHTDAIGSATYNRELSERRARSVGEYLIRRGVPATRMTSTGRGKTEPIASNSTEEGRQENRRVEVAIFAGDKMKADAKTAATSGG